MANFLPSSLIWMANSLVGATMMASGVWGLSPDLGSHPSSKMRCKMGNMKAAVFPLPVWAQAIKSRLLLIIGMADFWIGVGLTYPDLLMFSCRRARNSAASNVLTALGTFSPDALTWLIKVKINNLTLERINNKKVNLPEFYQTCRSWCLNWFRIWRGHPLWPRWAHKSPPWCRPHFLWRGSSPVQDNPWPCGPLGRTCGIYPVVRNPWRSDLLDRICGIYCRRILLLLHPHFEGIRGRNDHLRRIYGSLK